MIRLCKNCKDLKRLIEFLEKKQYKYTIEDCLDQCKICRDKYFLIKNNKLIVADDVNELLKIL